MREPFSKFNFKFTFLVGASDASQGEVSIIMIPRFAIDCSVCMKKKKFYDRIRCLSRARGDHQSFAFFSLSRRLYRFVFRESYLFEMLKLIWCKIMCRLVASNRLHAPATFIANRNRNAYAKNSAVFVIERCASQSSTNSLAFFLFAH